jgi:hypothetical protein
VDDELSELCRTAVRVAAMPHEELREVAELGDGEVGSKGCLLSFFSNDSDTCTRQGLKIPFGISIGGVGGLTNVSGLYHTDIITTVSDTANPFLGVVSD